MSLATSPATNAFGSPMVLEYNGFNFNNGSTQTLKAVVRGVPDETGRTTLYNLYSFEFRTVLAGTATDAAVVAARQALTKYGAPFRYSGRGLGDFAINVGLVRDVKWGPKPQEIAFKVLGPGNAVEITWSIEVAMPDCPDARYAFAPAAFVWSAAFNVTDGYTTRTISGYLEIPMTRPFAGARQLTQSVDAYREQIAPPVPEGFRRRYGPWVINEAKTRLTFEIVDEELPSANVPPPGVVRASASHSVSSSAVGLRKWQGVVSAEYELTKRGDASVAAAAFIALCRSRIEHLAVGLRKSGSGTPKSIIPITANFSEPEIYGRRRAAFSLGYSWTGSVLTVIGNSGLWRPVPGSDWRRWQAAMDLGPSHPRGTARLTFDVGDDKLVDLCGGPPNVGIGGRANVPPLDRPFRQNDYLAARQAVDGGGFAELIRGTFPYPKAADSWVYYESELFVEVDNGVVSLRTLPQAILDATDDLLGSVNDLAGQAWDAISGVLPTAPNLGGGNLLDNQIAGETRVQRRVRGMPVVYLIGRAARAGYPVPIPRLINVGGVQPIPANRLDRGEGYAQGVKFAAGDTPIYTARWRLRHVLPQLPTGGLPIPPNPILGST